MSGESRSKSLPPEVYLRRRSLALGLGAFILIIIIAGFIILARSGGSHAGEAPPGEVHTANSVSTPSSSVSAEASPTTDSELPLAPSQAQAGQPCSDTWLAMVVLSDKPTYSVGEQPKFTGVATNGSPLPCERDVGDGMQSFVVYSLDGSTRVWASQDCAPTNGQDVKMLNPGQQVAFQATWTGKTSEPGCQEERVEIEPGSYRVIAQLGQKISSPSPFNVVER